MVDFGSMNCLRLYPPSSYFPVVDILRPVIDIKKQNSYTV